MSEPRAGVFYVDDGRSFKMATSLQISSARKPTILPCTPRGRWRLSTLVAVYPRFIQGQEDSQKQSDRCHSTPGCTLFV